MPAKDPVKVFVPDTTGTEDHVAFFEETTGEGQAPAGGYLYISSRKERRIIRHLEIYKTPLGVKEHDVEMLWSSDGSKCGILIWGQMRGIIDLGNGKEISAPMHRHDSLGITDNEWLKGFDGYLRQGQFLKARLKYWQEMAGRQRHAINNAKTEAAPPETNFIVSAKGKDSWFAVFEDEGDTGYLYLFDSEHERILRHVHIYDRSERLAVPRESVQVSWSVDGTKCGVTIWSKMRGVIDRKKQRPGRVWMESRNTPGIDDREWLEGFHFG